jgi:hypothetical protein
MVGYLGHRQAVEIPQRQRRTLWPRQPRQRRVCGAGIEQLLPGIVGLVRSDGRKPTPFALAAPPVIHELVSCDADQPRDTHGGRVGALQGRNRGHERLSSQVLGIGNAAAAREQVAIHLGESSAVHRFVDT